MIVKSWKFTGFKSTFPDWVKENTSKRGGSDKLWVHTQMGEVSANEGEYIAITLRGHVDVYETKPEGWVKEIATGIVFAVLIISLMIFMLAW
tara:strand:- start:177 stop:452 length:276 start_codon:yes stop_codon:yes gene_type:complete